MDKSTGNVSSVDSGLAKKPSPLVAVQWTGAPEKQISPVPARSRARVEPFFRLRSPSHMRLAAVRLASGRCRCASCRASPKAPRTRLRHKRKGPPRCGAAPLRRRAWRSSRGRQAGRERPAKRAPSQRALPCVRPGARPRLRPARRECSRPARCDGRVRLPGRRRPGVRPGDGSVET
jgi:hypothetical protein